MLREGFIEIGNYKLRYSIQGQGIPTLVIGSAIYYPRTFSASLKDHLEMHFIDHRGFSEKINPTISEQPELDFIVEDIEVMRKKINLEKFILVGHSGHAFMALEYAKKYPQNVSHLILLGCGPDYSVENGQLAEEYFKNSVCPERKSLFYSNIRTLDSDLKSSPEKAFITFCLKFGPRSWFDYSFDASSLWEGVQVNMEVMDHIWGKIFREINILKNIENLNAPVYLGLGLHDYLVPPFFTWYKIKDQFKDLTLEIYPKSSHTPQFEESALFDEQLLNWIHEKKVKSV